MVFISYSRIQYITGSNYANDYFYHVITFII